MPHEYAYILKNEIIFLKYPYFIARMMCMTPAQEWLGMFLTCTGKKYEMVLTSLT